MKNYQQNVVPNNSCPQQLIKINICDKNFYIYASEKHWTSQWNYKRKRQMMPKVTENLKFFKSRFKYDNDDESSH